MRWQLRAITVWLLRVQRSCRAGCGKAWEQRAGAVQRGASQRGCNCRVNGAVKGYSLRHRAEGTLTLPCDVIDDRECALKRALARVSKGGQNQTLVVTCSVEGLANS